MKISQHFLDSMSHTAVVRKWGLSDFAEMVSLRREDWHWIQVLSQRAPKLHAPFVSLPHLFTALVKREIGAMSTRWQHAISKISHLNQYLGI